MFAASKEQGRERRNGRFEKTDSRSEGLSAKPGILFTTSLRCLKISKINTLIDRLWATSGITRLDIVAGIEARGFISRRSRLRIVRATGLSRVRKHQKSSAKTAAFSYALEYCTDTLESTKDAIKPGDASSSVDEPPRKPEHRRPPPQQLSQKTRRQK